MYCFGEAITSRMDAPNFPRLISNYLFCTILVTLKASIFPPDIRLAAVRHFYPFYIQRSLRCFDMTTGLTIKQHFMQLPLWTNVSETRNPKSKWPRRPFCSNTMRMLPIFIRIKLTRKPNWSWQKFSLPSNRDFPLSLCPCPTVIHSCYPIVRHRNENWCTNWNDTMET